MLSKLIQFSQWVLLKWQSPTQDDIYYVYMFTKKRHGVDHSVMSVGQLFCRCECSSNRAASSGDASVISIGRPLDATDSCTKTWLGEMLDIQEPPASIVKKTDFAKAYYHKVGMPCKGHRRIQPHQEGAGCLKGATVAPLKH